MKLLRKIFIKWWLNGESKMNEKENNESNKENDMDTFTVLLDENLINEMKELYGCDRDYIDKTIVDILQKYIEYHNTINQTKNQLEVLNRSLVDISQNVSKITDCLSTEKVQEEISVEIQKPTLTDQAASNAAKIEALSETSKATNTLLSGNIPPEVRKTLEELKASMSKTATPTKPVQTGGHMIGGGIAVGL